MVNKTSVSFVAPFLVFLGMIYLSFFSRNVEKSWCDGYHHYPKGVVSSVSYYKSITSFELLDDSIPDYSYFMGEDRSEIEKTKLFNYLKKGSFLERRGDSLYVVQHDTLSIWKIHIPDPIWQTYCK